MYWSRDGSAAFTGRNVIKTRMLCVLMMFRVGYSCFVRYFSGSRFGCWCYKL